MLTDNMLGRMNMTDLSSQVVRLSGYEIKDIDVLSPHQRLWLKGLIDDNKYRKLLLEYIRGLYES